MTTPPKTALITGATSGIGKVTAKHLAGLGMHLILPVRNMQKGEQTVNEITQATGNTHIRLVPCNLESLDSIRQCAQVIKNDYAVLDILINNAGVWFSKKELTADGFEKNIGINHLAPFLLTNLLLELLRKSESARIVNVSSEAHRFANMNFDDLLSEKDFNSFKAYGRSKLANILFTKKLSSMLAADGITVNCLHPGVVATNLFDKMGGFMKGIFQMFMITPEKGAQTTIHLATSDDVKGVSATYFKKSKPATSSPQSNNPEAAEKLWQLSVELTGLKS